MRTRISKFAKQVFREGNTLSIPFLQHRWKINNSVPLLTLPASSSSSHFPPFSPSIPPHPFFLHLRRRALPRRGTIQITLSPYRWLRHATTWTKGHRGFPSPPSHLPIDSQTRPGMFSSRETVQIAGYLRLFRNDAAISGSIDRPTDSNRTESSSYIAWLR